MVRPLPILALLGCSLAAQPDATEDILKRAIAMHQSGDVAAAITAYEQYLASLPDSFIAHSNLGAAYARGALSGRR
jgi:hypothetical protein